MCRTHPKPVSPRHAPLARPLTLNWAVLSPLQVLVEGWQGTLTGICMSRWADMQLLAAADCSFFSFWRDFGVGAWIPPSSTLELLILSFPSFPNMLHLFFMTHHPCFF